MTKDDLVILIEDDKVFADLCLNALVDVYGLVQAGNNVADGVLFKIICDKMKAVDEWVLTRAIHKAKEKLRKDMSEE